MKKETAINFMIYNLIGIDPETCNEMEKIIEQAIQRAYRDAASRVLSIKDDIKDEIKREAAQKLKSRIVSIDSKKERNESFDSWHEKTCEILYDFFNNDEKDGIYKDNDNRHFTCGIAQKWVNMTMKYLALIYEAFIGYDYPGKGLKKYVEWYKDNLYAFEAAFHIPIDSYVIKGLKACYKNDEKITQILSVTWSKWNDYEKYKKVQDAFRNDLKENEMPLDKENKIWIEIAEKRKAKEQSKSAK